MARTNDPNAPTHIIPPEPTANDVRELRQDLESTHKLLKDALAERQRAVEMAYSWKERAENSEQRPRLRADRVHECVDSWRGGLSPQGKAHVSSHDAAVLVSMLVENVLQN